MADNQRDPTIDAPKGGNDPDNLDRGRIPSTDSDVEREQARSSNDRELDGEGNTPKRNRGSGEPVHGQRGPTDPDSAESDIDRDDTVTD